jgi:hypothetical protein
MITFIVDAGLEETIVHIADVANGKYMRHVSVNGRDFATQTRKIITLMSEHQCKKLIVDDAGIGEALKEHLEWSLLHPAYNMVMDRVGNITHVRDHIGLEGDIL